MGRVRLIINADDFGWSRSITDGILRSHQDGIVTNTSLLANQAASDYAISQICHVPRLGVGIHLNLCSGAPVLPATQVPSLVGAEGHFHPAPEMLRRLARWQVSSREIEAEFRAQIRWARDRGVNLSHADSHYHVHVFPVAVGAFRRAARAEGITRTRPQRHVVMPRPGILPLVHAGPVYRQLAIAAYTRMLQFWAFRQFRCPDYQLVLPPKDRLDIRRHGEAWRLVFENLPPGTYEAICHPALSGTELNDIDNIRERREAELRIMTDPIMKSAIENRGVELINYHEL